MKNKIILLQISPGVPPIVGGEEKCTYTIYRYLDKNIFDVSILTGKNNLYENSKIPLIQCPTRGTPLNYLITFIKFLTHIRNVNIIHFHDPNFLFPNVTYGLIFLFVNKIFKKPYVLHIHLIQKFMSKFWLKFINLYNFYYKSLLKNAALILIPTNYSKKFLIKKYNLNPNHIQILPNGIDNQFFNIKTIKNDDFVKIIFIGRYSKVKNIDKLILAVINLHNNIHLHIYGSGEEELNLKKIASGHKSIIFEGRLRQNEVYKAYKGAKLMILPSSIEELPISILESLASGVPVLSTALPSVKSYFGDKIFYTDGSVEDLTKKIPFLLNQDLTTKINLGIAFAKNCTWETFISKLEKFYLEILKRYKNLRNISQKI